MTQYTTNINEASTFRSRFNAREAIAELDGCEVGCSRYHETQLRGDNKWIIARIGSFEWFSGNVGNRYNSQLNEDREKRGMAMDKYYIAETDQGKFEIVASSLEEANEMLIAEIGQWLGVIYEVES